MNYYLWTIGCQMNFADSRRVAEELARIGYHEVNRPQEADLILLNTCVVRQSAEDKVVGRLTSLLGLKRRKPNLRLVVMGCYVHEIPALQHQYPWVDAFVEPSDVESVVELARQKPAQSLLSVSTSPVPQTTVPISVGVPISHGCDHLCTYCIVRLRRGPESSRPIDQIVAEAQDLALRGAREITLLGQNVDSYGRDLPARAFPTQAPLASSPAPARNDRASQGRAEWRTPDLADLLEAIHQVEGLERIRFLTSHPSDMTHRLIEAVARLPKVCEHMEVPVQSGDDTVLRRMGRGYTVADFRALVAQIRHAMPGVGLATDIIVGFPGETEAQYEATYHLLEDLRFDMVHVAAYSPRPGTPAERLPDDISPVEKERRRKAVDALQGRIVGEINAHLLGQVVEVLVEERHKGKWRGRTRTNKLIFFDVRDRDWSGQLVQVRVTRTGPWSMQGEVDKGER
jgi:tRNA-2-methylthio-N6-dimethylallyladenosine synthase